MTPVGELPIDPVAVVFDTPEGTRTWIGKNFRWTNQTALKGRPMEGWLEIAGEYKIFPFGAITEVSSRELATTTHPHGYPVKIRQATQDDAVASHQFPDNRVPWPLPVISAMLSEDGVLQMPKLYALSDNQGMVSTLMLSADNGLYLRYAGAWYLLSDEDVVDGLNVHEVIDEAVDMFDQFDRSGQLVNINAYRDPAGNSVLSNGGALEGVDTAPPTGIPVTASGDAVREVPQLISEEDLPAAIEAAQLDPELQWWVERRAKAIGLTASFPWQS